MSKRTPLPHRALPLRIPVPGFVAKREVGLGDLIKRATASVGIKPCAGCQRRAEALNRRIIVGPKR